MSVLEQGDNRMVPPVKQIGGENSTIMPPEKQIVQDDRDARAEELESAFSYDGYQVVRKELFAHLRDPAIVIRKDSITFNTACITGLEDILAQKRAMPRR